MQPETADDRTICTKPHQLLHSQPGLSQGKATSHLAYAPSLFFLEEYFTLMLKNQSFQSSLPMVTYLEVQSALKPQVCSFKKTKQNNPRLFSHKNKHRDFGYDSKSSRYTTLSEPPWLGAAAGALPALQP